ncbi:MAG: hypothetical protein KC609_14520 [Myxococcales bacterium]|nr:hypothetical protein [Myxococcales bacterium]
MKKISICVASVAIALFLGASAHAAIPINWSSNALAYKASIGATFSFICPAGGSLSKSVYGTGSYTVDSGICVAAVHAGLINPGNGGVVKIRITPGLAAYVGSSRHGVSTRSWGRYHTSFVFVRGGVITATWRTSVSNYKGQIGRVLRFHCPAGGTPGKSVYGTGVYTIDSGVCVAAVHAGKISFASGGIVRLKIIGGQPNYLGTSQHGVSTTSWGRYHTSFVFQ